MNFDDWYREHEPYLETQPIRRFIAAAAWKAAQEAERERCAKVAGYWLAGDKPSSGSYEGRCLAHILSGDAAPPRGWP